MFNMLARSLAHTKWLFNPNIWAANWADPSGESIVEQPIPIGSEKKKTEKWVGSLKIKKDDNKPKSYLFKFYI